VSCRGGSPDTFAVEDNLRLGGDGVHVAEAKFGSIETDRVVERRQALVIGIYECDIRALYSMLVPVPHFAYGARAREKTPMGMWLLTAKREAPWPASSTI